MKTITFFSEKGGVGKSSFSIMYASWLHHKYGVKVALADFNGRINGYRDAEIESRNKFIKENPGTEIKPYDVNKTWPIIEAKIQEIRTYKKMGSEEPYANWFEHEVLDGRLNGFDVVLCDFPGSLSGGEFFQILRKDEIGLIVIPTERDQMTLQSTFLMHHALPKQNHCVFINRARLDLMNFRSIYKKFAKLLLQEGIPLLPDMVSFSERMMTIDKVDILRSTFGFPNFNDPQFGSTKDLGIENLFIDVTRELAKTSDVFRTEPADLSFVNDLKKVNDGRQIVGTPFKEYEI